jgi:uncharacterized protein with GYD domain
MAVDKPAIEPVGILLITFTEKGSHSSEKERTKERNEITAYVRGAGGQCQLFQTPGTVYDFVSLVTGVSSVAALFELLALIESGGNVKAQLLLGSDKSVPSHRPFKG